METTISLLSGAEFEQPMPSPSASPLAQIGGESAGQSEFTGWAGTVRRLLLA